MDKKFRYNIVELEQDELSKKRNSSLRESNNPWIQRGALQEGLNIDFSRKDLVFNPNKHFVYKVNYVNKEGWEIITGIEKTNPFIIIEPAGSVCIFGDKNEDGEFNINIYAIAICMVVDNSHLIYLAFKSKLDLEVLSELIKKEQLFLGFY